MSSSPDAPETLAQKARLVGWTLLVFAAAQFAGGYLAIHRIAASAVQASFAEWGTGQVGVAWSDPSAPAPKTSALVKRALLGAAMGLGAAVFFLVFARATHAGYVAKLRPSLGAMALGLVVPVLAAARDELLLRGYVIRILRGAPTWAVLLACGLAAAAWKAGSAMETDATLAAVITEGFAGVAFAALWLRDRGAWIAWGAHAAWAWATEPLMRWALFEVRAMDTHWGGGEAWLLGGFSSTCSVAILAAAAIAWSRRGRVPENSA